MAEPRWRRTPTGKPAHADTTHARGHLNCIACGAHVRDTQSTKKTHNMNKQTFFADVDTPFHVWVREASGAHGYRWVLRDASHLDTAQGTSAGTRASGRDGSVKTASRHAPQ